MALAPLVDGTLFVIDARKTTHDLIAEARRRLDQVGASVIGTVLNAGVHARWGHYYQAYEADSPPNGQIEGVPEENQRERA
jgi:Mrp family chromosome partitioning ATPase